MHGDFSRGHRPDGKRGQEYLRGLAQQRRLLLDADLNAMTDALHERLRRLANHTACPKGSPDLGYLITPGRLLALFRDLEAVTFNAAQVTVYRDYSRKYLDRYPSLYLHADKGVNATVTVRCREQAGGDTTFWCRAEVATTVTLSGGVALNVPANANLTPVTVNLANTQNIDITLNPGERVWIAMIERRQQSTLAPQFHIARGHFYLDGLPLCQMADAVWAHNLVPGSANLQVSNPARNLAAGDRLLAYLEGWERHVTAVEDPGIRENALGGDSDTTTRGRATGQVKLALIPAGFADTAFARALANPVRPNGLLQVTTPQPPPDPDPCALPVQGGYTGRDHRFYRFEVHTGGALGTAVFKWSRDNGAELFPVIEATNNTLTFAANTALQPDDLVEVLTADTIELGDASGAALSATGTFTPPVRAVGRLARLVPATSAGTGVRYTLREPGSNVAVTLAAHFGAFPSSTLKVRRWDGLFTTGAASPSVHEIENGIEISLTGSFTPCDYWQYEARAGLKNPNVLTPRPPDGPERDFTPLAILRFTASVEPLLLERWLDDRFPPLCELTADDIAFDGSRIGSSSDTVQEVIEELWFRNGGCCERTLSPTAGDAAVELRRILQETQGEITICLRPGVYRLQSVVDITGRKVVIKGCPRALLFHTVDGALRVTGNGALALHDVIAYGRQGDGVLKLVEINGGQSFEGRRAGLYLAPPSGLTMTQLLTAPPSMAIRCDQAQPAGLNVNQPFTLSGSIPGEVASPAITLHECTIAAVWGISANQLDALEIVDSSLFCSFGCVSAVAMRNFDLRGSRLQGGVNVGVVTTFNPDTMLANAYLIPDQFTALNTPAPGSSAIRVTSWFLGSITGCLLVGQIAAAGRWIAGAKCSGNTYYSTHTGFYVVEADYTTLSGETIAVLGGPFGVQVGLRGGISITDCEIFGAATGIDLGGALAVSLTRVFMNLQIQNTAIVETVVGIQVGPRNGTSWPGLVDHVTIAENGVVASAIGISVNAQGTGGNFAAGALRARVRVADNQVTARMGIGVTGPNVELSDNRITIPTGTGARFGVLTLNASNVVCEHNQLDVRLMQNVGPVNYAGQLPSDAVATAGSLGAYLANVNVGSAAIAILSGSDARVLGNVAARDVAADITALRAENHARLHARGNELLCGNSSLTNTADLVFSSNTAVGEVDIIGSTDGVVTGNRIRGGDAGHLDITSARGRWQVADNRADGRINVVPALQTSGGFNFWEQYTGSVLKGYSLNSTPSIKVIGDLSGNKDFQAKVTRSERSAMTISEGPGEAAIAVGDPQWRENYASGVNEFILAGAEEVLAEANFVLPPMEVIVIVYSTEVAYQVQCSNNWSRTLQVGNLNVFVFGNSQSTVQVTGNRADDTMGVRAYQRLVMALNVANSYTHAGLHTSQAILQPNLEI